MSREVASKTASVSRRPVGIPGFVLATVSLGGMKPKIRKKGVGTAASSKKYFPSGKNLTQALTVQVRRCLRRSG